MALTMTTHYRGQPGIEPENGHSQIRYSTNTTMDGLYTLGTPVVSGSTEIGDTFVVSINFDDSQSFETTKALNS